MLLQRNFGKKSEREIEGIILQTFSRFVKMQKFLDLKIEQEATNINDKKFKLRHHVKLLKALNEWQRVKMANEK
jgi:hypothetical protein